MTKTCPDSFRQVMEVLHTNLIWSHIFYILTSLIALYFGNYVIFTMVIILTIVSIMHHIDTSVKLWARADAIIATLSMLLITGFFIYTIIKKKISIYTDDSKKYILFLFIIITIFAIITFILTKIPKKNQTDPIIGNGNMFIVKTTREREKEIKKCGKYALEFNYSYYHILWHIFSGLAGVFIVILIST